MARELNSIRVAVPNIKRIVEIVELSPAIFETTLGDEAPTLRLFCHKIACTPSYPSQHHLPTIKPLICFKDPRREDNRDSCLDPSQGSAHTRFVRIDIRIESGLIRPDGGHSSRLQPLSARSTQYRRAHRPLVRLSQYRPSALGDKRWRKIMPRDHRVRDYSCDYPSCLSVLKPD
jgi:hypothetical protein